MADSEYTAWLSQYTEKLKQMNSIEKECENRTNYYDPSQIKEDYLDYVEEWNWTFNNKKPEVLQRFIYLAAARHLKIACDNHYHTLTTRKNESEGDLIVDSPKTLLFQTCLYRQLAKTFDNATPSVYRNFARLPDPVESLLRLIGSMALMEKGSTPYLLPMDLFQQYWWRDEDRTPDQLKAIFYDFNKTERDRVDDVRSTLEPKVSAKEILLDFPDSDHGLHSLMRLVGENESFTWIKWINKQRTKLDSRARLITKESLNERIKACEFCKHPSTAGMSVPGIYYAPPGGGKTTAQNLELLIGFDTDWIGIGLNWTDYGWILKKRVPIITNQPEIFIGSGVKIIGIVKQRIRLGCDGKPLDSASRLMRWAKEHDRSVYFIKAKDNKYFSDYALTLQMLAMVQSIISDHTINKLPYYKNNQTVEWGEFFPKLMKRKEKEERRERTSLIS